MTYKGLYSSEPGKRFAFAPGILNDGELWSLGDSIHECSLITDGDLRILYPRLMTEGLHRFYGGNDFHFLTFSCYRRQPLFCDDTRGDLFLKILERVRRRYRLVVLGYVVMPEHVHLLVNEPQRETLSTTIQALKLGFVRTLQCSSGESFMAAPTSRKRGETWGTQ